MQSQLYVVPTPIGNLSDMSMRALEILKNVDIIASEDTRHIRKLLSHFKISTPCVSFHAGSDPEKIIRLLEEGKRVALCSDAGTPCISDPGHKLVYDACQAGFRSVPIAGASAFLMALSACCFPSNHFEFFGFMPHKKGREKLFKNINELEHTAVLYESTHRIMKFLEQAENLLDQDRQICIAREISKIYEEFLYGNAKELKEILSGTPEKQKGEFTVIIAPRGFG
ncbi:MAG: 16S rRNA (cytidine(1402)-2'-O)-methyltransferase [Candidatus Gracilibacteria bacterium]|jgi:16S rRNA (cytidine1402-2'-O)-methyltransferase|nr:16S rRNA (cytidine(1402)-2'-O)-methyltransferase [Candidatus Gracilibacteria bacterium]